jgi:predicted transcriptional regulator
MPTISQQKQEKIQEQILFHLFQTSPKPIFTSDIANELARDEEFIKKLLQELLKKQLVVKIDKNPQGIKYTQRTRWRLSSKVSEAYRKQLR